MKRMHVHISVDDLEKSKRFYAAMFAQPPTVSKADYAKWILEDPRINLAISHNAGKRPGLAALAFRQRATRNLKNFIQGWQMPATLRWTKGVRIAAMPCPTNIGL